MVIDLSATTYLDSAGINLLFALGEEMRGRQQRSRSSCADASPIARMVALTGLDRAMPVHRDAAGRARRAPRRRPT